MPTEKQGFCLLPWIHSHVSAQGFRKLCCVDMAAKYADPRIHNETIDDYWNGPELRSVRRQMLAGTLPERCVICTDKRNRSESYREQILRQWPDLVEPAITSTTKDGATTLRPITFDHRSSLCNFRCRTCGPHSSTSLESEVRNSPLLRDIGEDGANWPVQYRSQRSNAMANSRVELLQAVKEGRIRHLYWAGGEPLIDETHWEVMEALVEAGHASKVDVAYNTNLSRLTFRNRSIEALWPHFRGVHIQASVDGLGGVGHYVRSGFNEATFHSNVEIVRQLEMRHKKINLVLDITITSVGLLHLEPLLTFALKNNIPATAKLMVPRKNIGYLALDRLPASVLLDWCNNWLRWLEVKDTFGVLSGVAGALKVAIDRSSECIGQLSSEDKNALAAFELVRGETGAFAHLMAKDKRLLNWLAE